MIKCLILIEIFRSINTDRSGFIFLSSYFSLYMYLSLMRIQPPTVITVQLFYTLHWFKYIHTNTTIKIFTFCNRFHQKKIYTKIIFLFIPKWSVCVSVSQWHSDHSMSLFRSSWNKYELSIILTFFLFMTLYLIHLFGISLWDKIEKKQNKISKSSCTKYSFFAFSFIHNSAKLFIFRVQINERREIDREKKRKKTEHRIHLDAKRQSLCTERGWAGNNIGNQ